MEWIFKSRLVGFCFLKSQIVLVGNLVYAVLKSVVSVLFSHATLLLSWYGPQASERIGIVAISIKI